MTVSWESTVTFVVRSWGHFCYSFRWFLFCSYWHLYWLLFLLLAYDWIDESNDELQNGCFYQAWSHWMIVNIRTFLFQAHIHNVGGRILETVLSLRFFIFQYGVVYHMDASESSKALLVCFQHPFDLLVGMKFVDQICFSFFF